MFKKAKSRPSLRARDSEDLATTSSPLAKLSITADDADTSIDVEDDHGDVSMGSVFERKKAGKRDKDKRRERPLGSSQLWWRQGWRGRRTKQTQAVIIIAVYNRTSRKCGRIVILAFGSFTIILFRLYIAAQSQHPDERTSPGDCRR
jgi:hypothetical protein